MLNRKSSVYTGLIILLLISSSCSSGRASRQQRYAEKAQVELEKENEKRAEAYHEYHFNRQADETQEMIKKSKKRAKKLNRKKQTSFFDRIFKRKSPGCGSN